MRLASGSAVNVITEMGAIGLGLHAEINLTGNTVLGTLFERAMIFTWTRG